MVIPCTTELWYEVEETVKLYIAGPCTIAAFNLYSDGTEVGRTGFHPVYIINASTTLEEQNKEDTKECIAFFPVLKIPNKF